MSNRDKYDSAFLEAFMVAAKAQWLGGSTNEAPWHHA